MSAARVDLIPYAGPFGLNYIYALHTKGCFAIVDPGEAACVIDYCDKQNLRPDMILITHQDCDHVDGLAELKERYQAQVFAPKMAGDIADQVDVSLVDGDSVQVGDASFDVIATPGHTQDHICFASAQAKALFSGDCLFILGCGRVRTGMQDMWESLRKLRTLPDDLRVFCGHEYTQGNITFLKAMMRLNADQQGFCAALEQKIAAKEPTIPSELGQEKRCNPFLNADKPDFIAAMGLNDGKDGGLQAFTQMRESKDKF